MSDLQDAPIPLLEARALTKIFADGKVTALCDANFKIMAGEFVAVMGPSGSGKSTLLQLIGALDKPTRGEVYFRGQPLSQAKSLDAIRATEIGFVFQSFYLLPNLTSLENVQIPMFGGPRGPAARKKKAAELLDLVGMSHRADHRPTGLSVGERQRVAIARALANDPAVLLADEPTGNLDSQTGCQILDLFTRLHAECGRTIVVITHAIEIAERAERLIRLCDGRVEYDEPIRRQSST